MNAKSKCDLNHTKKEFFIGKKAKVILVTQRLSFFIASKDQVCPYFCA